MFSLQIQKKAIGFVLFSICLGVNGHAQNEHHSMYHEMQHGFVLSAEDTFASHLVAPGHHSRQTEITGQLFVEDVEARALYEKRKVLGTGSSYFLFQAQSLDLPSLSSGQVLTGHIVESTVGEYQPKNKIVSLATYRVDRVLLNIPNPFFLTETKNKSSLENSDRVREDGGYIRNLLNPIKAESKHCCETGKKPCNWKC
jgi:hypothetical protein